jgi:hypothetical protein
MISKFDRKWHKRFRKLSNIITGELRCIKEMGIIVSMVVKNFIPESNTSADQSTHPMTR